ncbi:prolyl oligopeptidase family serine peptidase [Pseudoalteromonas sp. SS15]|uniref:alpha/beta hydrolase family protein n=1 Tax=Pseudoalteromonas sp. SS15 TaxID=3139393 RepID=UPI003BAD769A
MNMTDIFSGMLRCALILWVMCTSSAKAEFLTDLNEVKQRVQQKKRAPLLPAVHFLQSERIQAVTLSPNADYVLYLSSEEKAGIKRWSLNQYTLADLKTTKLVTLRKRPSFEISKDGSAVFVRVGEQLSVLPLKHKAKLKRLAKIDWKKKERFLGVDPSQPASFLVKKWRTNERIFEILSIAASGKAHVIWQTTLPFSQLLVNANTGNAAFIKQVNTAEGNRGERFIHQIQPDGPLKLTFTCQWDDKCQIQGFNDKSQQLLIQTNHDAEFKRLAWFDLKTQTLLDVAAQPQQAFDLVSATLGEDENGSLTPTSYLYEGAKTQQLSRHPVVAKHLTHIREYLEGKAFTFALPASIKAYQAKPWLISLQENSPSTQYYIYQPQQQTLQRILNEQANALQQNDEVMKDAWVSEKVPVQYQSRDGFNLYGYLTLPNGVALSDAPLVVKAHGGPFSQVKWGFDRQTQLLANRGYIVFEPNFRASTGYGKGYEKGANKQFGLGITHNDIIDGTHFILSQGIGNKHKLAIIGHSFGGFSSLTALTFEAKLFKVGFAGAPGLDIGRSARLYYRFAEKVRGQFSDYYFRKMIVDWDDKAAKAQLTANSPSAHPDKIQSPVFVWAGRGDRKIFINDVNDYVLRLQEANKAVSYFVDPSALHSPTSKQGVLAYSYLLERVLAKYLDGQYLPLDPNKDKRLIRFIKKHMEIDKLALSNEL